MKYALNLGDDGHILSVTFEKYADETYQIVDKLPEGDAVDYRYVSGEFIYDPIPREKIEIQPTYEQRIARLEEENVFLTECLLEMSEMLYA